LTEIYLCHACACHEILSGNGRGRWGCGRQCAACCGERAVASFLAAILAEIYLCASCSSCHETLGNATARVRFLVLLIALLCAGNVVLGWRLRALEEEQRGRAEQTEAEVRGGSSASAPSEPVTLSSSYVLERSPAIPFQKFARVCRCFQRPVQAQDMHIVGFEAIVDHIYSQTSTSPGFSWVQSTAVPVLSGEQIAPLN
jgi:hypothetical protein